MSKIRVGDKVELNNNIYVVTEIYKNFKGEAWAVCLNTETKETPHHPVRNLNPLD